MHVRMECDLRSSSSSLSLYIYRHMATVMKDIIRFTYNLVFRRRCCRGCHDDDDDMRTLWSSRRKKGGRLSVGFCANCWVVERVYAWHRQTISLIGQKYEPFWIFIGPQPKIALATLFDDRIAHRHERNAKDIYAIISERTTIAVSVMIIMRAIQLCVWRHGDIMYSRVRVLNSAHNIVCVLGRGNDGWWATFIHVKESNVFRVESCDRSREEHLTAPIYE